MPTISTGTTHTRGRALRADHELRLLAKIIAAVVTVDIALKSTIAALLAPRHEFGPLVSLTNPRFLLGLTGTQQHAMVVLMVLGLFAATIVAILLLRRSLVSAPAMGLVIGGGAANTVDRAVHGAVQDYLLIGDVVVNLADMAVIAGFIMTMTSLVGHARTRHLRSTPSSGAIGQPRDGQSIDRKSPSQRGPASPQTADRGPRWHG